MTRKSRYARFVVVLLSVFVLTALFAAMLVFLLHLYFKLDSNMAGFAIFITVISFMVSVSRSMALRFLFDRSDSAEFQVLGGVRLGNDLQSATWPFVKLSASEERLQIQTPFEVFKWEKNELERRIQRTGLLPGQWNIGSASVIFLAMPWAAKNIESKLKALGYNFE